MAFSTYFATQILNWLKGTTFPSPPSNLYVSIHSADPTDDGSVGNILSSVTGSSSRILFSQADLDTQATSGGGYIRDNTAVIQITTASVNSSPVTWSHAALWDAASGGNLLLHGPLASSLTINPGSNVRFDIGNFVAKME
jgi:hypothetical protein